MKNGEQYLRDVTNIARNISVRITYVLSPHVGVHRSSLVQHHAGHLPSNMGRAPFGHTLLGKPLPMQSLHPLLRSLDLFFSPKEVFILIVILD